MNLITNKHCKERRLVGKSGGGEIISFIVLPPLRHTRRTGRPSRIEITQFFWKLFPVDFGFLKFLGNGDIFFKRLQSEDTSRTCIWTSGRISQIPRIGRFRGQMQLVCILFETMSMFSFPDMQRGQPGEKENLVFCITWAWLKKNRAIENQHDLYFFIFIRLLTSSLVSTFSILALALSYFVSPD